MTRSALHCIVNMLLIGLPMLQLLINYRTYIFVRKQRPLSACTLPLRLPSLL